jgi:phage terminase large subunit-like protein
MNDAAEKTQLVQRITLARNSVSQREQARAAHEARFHDLTEEIKAFGARIRSEGIDPTKLDEAIEAAKAEVNTLLTDLERDLGLASAS